MVPGTWGISATVGATCVAPSMSSRADAGHTMMLRGVSCRSRFQSLIKFSSSFHFLVAHLLICVLDPRPEDVLLPTEDPVLPTPYH